MDNSNEQIFDVKGYQHNSFYKCTIGRLSKTGWESEFHIQIPPKEKSVSGIQADLRYDDNAVLIKSLSNSNFTVVNGFELKAG